jgi:hypothetical protein
MKKSRRGDPGISGLYGTTPSPGAIGSFRPLKAEGTIAKGKQKVLQERLQTLSPRLCPVVMERPPIEFGNRHERDYDKFPVYVRAIQLSAAVLFEHE